MAKIEFVLSRDQRDEILTAVKVIGRQLKEMSAKPHTHSQCVLRRGRTCAWWTKHSSVTAVKRFRPS
jgi:hypothetical protein